MKANPPPCSVEELRDLLDLDAETGTLYWRIRPFTPGPASRLVRVWNTRWAGKPALTAPHSRGYRSGTVNHVSMLAHRVVYALHNGVWPEGDIDHINGDRSDNRPSNLRDVPRGENAKNMAMNSRNTSGRTGVSWCAPNRKWRVGIRINGKQHWLGLFECFEDAVAVREQAERDAGYHPNHGRAVA
jgi:hypothetical protein